MTVITWILLAAFFVGLVMIWRFNFIHHDTDKAMIAAYLTIIIGVACIANLKQLQIIIKFVD